MKQLLNLYRPDPSSPERVGFISSGGAIVECENIAQDPVYGFAVSGCDILAHLDAVATWHTHPGASSNLSMDDHSAFLNFPDMKHFIIGSDGVRCYEVRDGVIHAA